MKGAAGSPSWCSKEKAWESLNKISNGGGITGVLNLSFERRCVSSDISSTTVVCGSMTGATILGNTKESCSRDGI